MPIKRAMLLFGASVFAFAANISYLIAPIVLREVVPTVVLAVTKR